MNGMRLSIWQQWASNHSAAFTLMGKFQTVEEAQRAGNILKDILRQVAQWKKQDYEARWQAYQAAHQIQQPTPADREGFEKEYYGSEFIPDPTEIEQQLAEQYGVQWFQTIEYARDPDIAPQAVMIADRAVIVDEALIDEYTWTGPWPFGDLLKKFGAKVALWDEIITDFIQVTIRCTAPDDAAAARLLAQVRRGDSGSRNADLMIIDDLDLASSHVDDWVKGQVTRDGLQLTYVYREAGGGRYFAALLDYLRAHGCTAIDYDFVGEL